MLAENFVHNKTPLVQLTEMAQSLATERYSSRFLPHHFMVRNLHYSD